MMANDRVRCGPDCCRATMGNAAVTEGADAVEVELWSKFVYAGWKFGPRT